MKINLLSNKISWFGKYSGYECLPNYFPKNEEVSIHHAESGLLNKVIGKVVKMKNGWDLVKPETAYSEYIFKKDINKAAISHILYLESHIHLFDQAKFNLNKVTGTIHLPYSRWSEQNLGRLSHLKNAVILYKEEIDKFKKFIPAEHIHVIRHGVDIDFFKPGDNTQINRNKILVVGHFLRDFDTLLKAYTTILSDISDQVELHIIIPAFLRQDNALQALAKQKNVFFHEKLSDEEMLAHYQDSNVLMMPMEDSGANTAIVQAIAVGLPIITTDAGGIRSYGGGEVYPLVAPKDHLKMVELYAKYYNDPEFRNQASKDLRDFAVQKMDWHLIAQEHIQLYTELQKKTTV